MKTKLFFFPIFLLFVICSTAQTKHALVIAISNYPQIAGREKNWAVLSSKNDCDLVMEMLKRQEFDQKNIISLLDKEATVSNIEKAFDDLNASVKEGDIVYFHFSGHGQQVEDIVGKKNGNSKILTKDEKDGYDEALVTYNAPVVFEKGYQFQDHFVDDQMKYYMNRLRKKIGGKGQVIAVFDCCHSGSATRGSNEVVVRGTSTICASPDYRPGSSVSSDSSLAFDTDFDYVNSDEMAKLTAFFACKSEQVAREILEDKSRKGYGSLTYYLIKSMQDLGPNSSYNNLFSKINEKMVIGFKNQQHPEIEGDNLNQLIFKGTFVDQKPYYKIIDRDLQEITIDGGSLQGLSVGDSVGIYSNTTISPKGQKALYDGIVTAIEPYSAKVTLSQPFYQRKDAEVMYRTFVTYSAAPAIKCKLNITVKSKTVRKELEALFAKEKAIELVDKGFDYQIVDTMYNGNADNVVVYLGPDKQRPLRGMTPRAVKGNPIQADSLLQFIKQSMKTDLFRKLNLEEESLSFEYKIAPCSSDGTCSYDSSKILNGNLRFSDKSKFQLIVKNTGTQRLYGNVIDIDPNNVLKWFSKSDMKNFELLPGAEKKMKITVSKPYGIEQMKVIATDRPVDFSSLEENGTSLTRGGENSPLLDFVDKSVNGTRGAGGEDATGATVKTLTFEIMEK